MDEALQTDGGRGLRGGLNKVVCVPTSLLRLSCAPTTELLWIVKVMSIKAVYSALLVVGLAACSPLAPSYERVGVERLALHPREYEGKPVIVEGFLLFEYGQMVLLDGRWSECRGEELERSYVTTTLPLSLSRFSAGEPTDFEGRLVEVSGVLQIGRDPWRIPDQVVQKPPWRTVGPLRQARIESIREERCILPPIQD